MKICLAQTKSIKGDLSQNIQIHLDFIQSAVEWGTDLIVFPELSLTGYEPRMAEALAKNFDDPIFDPFQKKSDKFNISIGTGMPLKTNRGIVIGMLIFQPNADRIYYAKQVLHPDEISCFVPGDKQIFLSKRKEKIALAICYEALDQAHFQNAKESGATIYLASTAKSQTGILKVNSHFSKISKDFSTPVLMVNNIGYCDNFMAAGQTTAWDSSGNIIDQLDSHRSGLLWINLDSGITKKQYFESPDRKIQLGEWSDLPALVTLFQDAKDYLDQQKIFQWTDFYPSKEVIEKDLKDQTLFVLKDKQVLIGAVTLNDHQDEEYQSIPWKFSAQKVLVIHRLMVDPTFQNQGYAKQLMNFAEAFAKKQHYSSIRLDTYTKNKISFEFYKKRNYVLRGTVFFRGRKDPFYCLEKDLNVT